MALDSFLFPPLFIVHIKYYQMTSFHKYKKVGLIYGICGTTSVDIMDYDMLIWLLRD